MTGFPQMSQQRPGGRPFQILKPIVTDEPKKEAQPEPEMKDEFTDLFDLAKTSITSKTQTGRKATPFDEDLYSSSKANEIYRQKMNINNPHRGGTDQATELFGNVRPQMPGGEAFGGMRKIGRAHV